MDGVNVVACVFFRNEKVDVRLLRSCIASLENSVGMKPSNVGKCCCGVLYVCFLCVCGFCSSAGDAQLGLLEW